MTTFLSEEEIEEIGLEILQELGYDRLFGPDIGPEGDYPERERYQDVLLKKWLRRALRDLNSHIPDEAIDEAIRELERVPSQNLTENNRHFHKLLLEGVPVQIKKEEGDYEWRNLRVIDFSEPRNNSFLAVNQYTVIEGQNNKRPDTVLFVNGVPLVVIEYKSPSRETEDSTLDEARNQLETYKTTIPSLFNYNAFLVISDGLQAREGTINSSREWFLEWKTIDGRHLEPTTRPQLEVLLRGMCNKETLLQLLRHFIVFEDDGGKITKKIAAYHQYHAVQKAVEKTLEAASPEGDKRCGVVWHTQGSGKSLSMVFYTGKLVVEPDLENPTIVVLTDRNDLDDQLFQTFSRCSHLIRQTPVQAESREHLQELLSSAAAGGIYFTTLQKFLPPRFETRHPVLSTRRNIIFIADEAHRSHYEFQEGYAQYLRDALPNASFIGFTGTPLDLDDRNTVAIFGDYIDTYDIQQSVEDGNTVRIYYENRVAKIELPEEARPSLDEGFEEITEDREEEERERLKTKWSQLEAVVGQEDRLRQIADDIIEHFEARENELGGKAMIVCMSRRICVDLYNQIIKLRPKWHSPNDEKGYIKIVMSGSSSDVEAFQPHIRSKARRRFIADRFKDCEEKENPLKLVIVRDMWLTGFDVPCLHTMYVDKPMRGHTLMQAIARVNRVFKDKEGGLVVDYIGLAYDLKQALARYSQRDRDNTGIDQERAVRLLLTKYEVILNMFNGFDLDRSFTGDKLQRLTIANMAVEHVLGLEDGAKRYLQHSLELLKAYRLAVPNERALKISHHVGFFKAVRAAIINLTRSDPTRRSQWELDQAIKQLLADAISSDEVIDIFTFAGIQRPDISILDDRFLQEVRNLETKNLAAELLQKLLNGEIRARSRRNLIQGKTFSEKLESTIIRYHNRSITTVQVIEELIKLAQEMKETSKRGQEIGLTEDELAFYDALETNDSAVAILGDKVLKQIAQELTRTIRNNVTIDWTLRENIRAKLRVRVKRILRKYEYPPDKQQKATETVIKQAEMLSEIWVESNFLEYQ